MFVSIFFKSMIYPNSFTCDSIIGFRSFRDCRLPHPSFLCKLRCWFLQSLVMCNWRLELCQLPGYQQNGWHCCQESSISVINHRNIVNFLRMKPDIQKAVVTFADRYTRTKRKGSQWGDTDDSQH